MTNNNNNANNTAIIGLQWGDEGKGKIVDYLADKFNSVIRFQGGNNAGHTIKVGDKTFKLSLLPSGVVQGKFSVIGSGLVVDPVALFKEIDAIKAQGVDINPTNLVIANNVCLILSVHREVDQLLEQQKGEAKIGTTGRGIGPAYEDKMGRRSIRLADLFDDQILHNRLENLLFYHNLLRKSLNASEVKIDDLLAEISSIKDRIKPFAMEPYEIAQKLSSLTPIMFEGAQGALLDIDYGTFPFVTSSNTMSGQVTLGSCLGVADLHHTLGILKCYTTRVGSGPFPTELDDEIGQHLASKGQEIGTVTGRNRRCGWLDACLFRYIVKLSNVKEVALTKLDVLDDLEIIKICTGYKIDNKVIDYLPQSQDLWSKITPIYEEFPGWQQSTYGVTKFNDLAQNAKDYIARIQELSGVKIKIISTGPKRDQTIYIS
jgi:adenylosuccinate synthase|tara:strand:+ start:11510 stop:12802 length:1293 start_codon:yes stop_codon:yes gene_type:complete